MSDKAFLDTNIIIYFYSEDDDKKRSIANQVLNDYDCVTSIQAMNEFSNVMFRKFSWDATQIKAHLDNIEMVCDEVLPIHRSTINNALALKDRYGFSYFDCLMLASALEGACHVIFTEDMNDGQIINNTLKMSNPFKKT